MTSRTIEQHARADDIGVNEVEWRIDTAVDMRFSGKVNYGVKLMVGRERIHLIGIGNIGFEKFVAFAMFLDHAIKVGEVTGVSERVDVGHASRLVMLQNISNKIAPDETAAARHENAHCSAY